MKEQQEALERLLNEIGTLDPLYMLKLKKMEQVEELKLKSLKNAGLKGPE
jgi:hypothetical protein